MQLAWNGELTTPARDHKEQHFQPNNFSTVTRYVPEHNQTNMKGSNDLANAFLFFLSKSPHAQTRQTLLLSGMLVPSFAL